MYPILLIVIFTWLAYLVGSQTTANIEMMKAHRAQVLKIDLQNLNDSVNLYFLEYAQYPSTLNVLNVQSGYEFNKTSVNNSIGYSTGTNLTDSVWTFSRSVFFQYNPQIDETPSSVSAINTCGSGTVSSAANWCGSPYRFIVRNESREFFNQQLIQQRVRQQRLMQKFAAYFNDLQYFPNKDQSNTALVVGQTYSLSTLTGYIGSAANCSGNYTWRGIPIDCNDMFDLWGNNVAYSYLSNTHIALVSASPVKNSSGVAITVATDLDAS